MAIKVISMGKLLLKIKSICFNKRINLSFELKCKGETSGGLTAESLGKC